MEGDTKRVKLEIVEDGPVLKYLTGELVDPRDIEQNWNIENQILLLLLQTGSFADAPASDVLKKLEKLNNKWYQFIAKSQAWKVLFSKKYPEQFRYAIEKPEWFREVKAKLDSFSANPGREHTYWKRWYEFLSKSRKSSLITWVGLKSFLLNDLKDRENDRDDVFVTSQDSRVVFHHIDRTQNIIFVCFANITPEFMLSINLLTAEQKIIPYDEAELGAKIVFYDGSIPEERVTYSFESLDGFMYFELGANSTFETRIVRLHNFTLVSCQQCQVNDAQYVERNLRGLFCSERCQREFRLK